DKSKDKCSLIDSDEEDFFDEEDVFDESVLPDRPLPSCNWGCENKVYFSLIINPISGYVETPGFHTRSQSISSPTNIRNTLLVVPLGTQPCATKAMMSIRTSIQVQRNCQIRRGTLKMVKTIQRLKLSLLSKIWWRQPAKMAPKTKMKILAWNV
ncbi:hypothetical protein LINGRAPRIM_LOCUS2548, partial [Linum grandiflorum]